MIGRLGGSGSSVTSASPATAIALGPVAEPAPFGFKRAGGAGVLDRIISSLSLDGLRLLSSRSLGSAAWVEPPALEASILLSSDFTRRVAFSLLDLALSCDTGRESALGAADWFGGSGGSGRSGADC